MEMEPTSQTSWSFDIDMHKKSLEEHMCSTCKVTSCNIDPCNELNRCKWGALEPFSEDLGENLFDHIWAVEDLHFLIRRRIVFAHRDFEFARDVISNIQGEGRQRFAVVTGLMLHEKLHLGHKCVIDQLKWYQDRGADIFIALSDVESWIEQRRGINTAIRDAMISHLLSYFALGIKPIPKKCQIYSEWARREIFCTALALSGATGYSKWSKKWRIADQYMNLGQVFFPFIVAADILHVQLRKFGGKRPTVVPVGINQFKYLNVATNLIEEYNRLLPSEKRYYPPSITYHRLLVGTDLRPMAAENRNAIFLSDSPDVVSRKLLGAATGGKETLEEQKKYGGNPSRCAPFDMYKFNHPDDRAVKRVFADCISGNTSCYDCKQRIIGYFKNSLRNFQKEREELKDSEEILRFMLAQDILRETESITEITEI